MTDNPSVNRALDNEAMDHIDHALGRPLFPLQETFRNFFATEVGGPLALSLSISPHWRLAGVREGMACYVVTDAGRRALATHIEASNGFRAFDVHWRGHSRRIPAETASKARYKYYLMLKEVCPDLGFSEFCSAAHVRRAA